MTDTTLLNAINNQLGTRTLSVFKCRGEWHCIVSDDEGDRVKFHGRSPSLRETMAKARRHLIGEASQ